VRIARRAGELPECFALFQAGILGEDTMVRIARRVRADRDADVAALAPEMLVSQLDRLLASLPELPDPTPRPSLSRNAAWRSGATSAGTEPEADGPALRTVPLPAAWWRTKHRGRDETRRRGWVDPRVTRGHP
jgi:hypothetical protein